MRIAAVAAGFILIFNSCRHDKADLVDPQPVCDSLHPSYKLCVQPLLQQHCYVCHSDAASANGQNSQDLENFQSLKHYLATMHYRGDSIYGSKFEALIEQRLYVIPMPPNGKLPAADIRLMERWISEGAPDN